MFTSTLIMYLSDEITRNNGTRAYTVGRCMGNFSHVLCQFKMFWGFFTVSQYSFIMWIDLFTVTARLPSKWANLLYMLKYN